MTQRTVLAHGQVTPGDYLTIELIKPDNEPAAVFIHWPSKPHSRSTTADFQAAAARATQLFAAAATKFAHVRLNGGMR